MLELEALPADEGDCLLLTCHTAAGPRSVLVDGGTARTAPRLLQRLQQLPGRRLELLVVTHIDADHIAGMVRLLRDPALQLDIGDAWFNGLRHCPQPPGAQRGPADGERLTDLLTGEVSGRTMPWNLAFGGGAVQRNNDDPKTGETTAELPVVTLPWGLRITLLSPTPRRLAALRPGWDRYLAQLHREESSEPAPAPAALRGDPSLEELATTATANDGAAPNGSSIAFLAEFGGRSVLFGADAFPTVLYPALLRLARQRAGLPPDTDPAQVPPLLVDVFKLPHHGSRANVALPLFDLLRADHYLVSTSGHRFRHPDAEAMARVITRGRPADGRRHTLWFNHVSATTRRWQDPLLAQAHDYAVDGARSEAEPGALIRL
ncbi:ComEC/Rec2 family competence protein [Aquabacterium sp.]|uniref:ComEC/Rec2 family competence protein n=1 Tax=Aquabacterium sp. TaxID=1872578 RepID=UPI002D7FAD87|nr:MBL fold metallo-hydrolase [Aquabacterium sp.]